MNGTENQITWAMDIKKTLISTWSEMKELFTSDKRFDSSNPQHISLASKFDNNIAALESLDAHDLIDIFSRVDKNDTVQKRYKSIAACITVSANPKSKIFIK